MSHYNAMCQSGMSINNSNNILEMTESKVKVNDRAQHRKEWNNPMEFLMTCVGFAVGLGNVWRFPYLCFKNGGSAFVIAFSSMLFFIGLPLFYLEITLAQFSKMGPLEIWKVVPAFRGLGICSLLLSTFIAFYYNILICYSLIYAVSSFMPTLPWTRCDFFWNTDKCCMGGGTPSINATITNALTQSCPTGSESPAKQYFNNFVLDISDDIGNVGYINWKIAVGLLICWLLIFLALSQGVQSLGKVSYITAIFPYIMITALIIRGATLPGAIKGIEYYILKVNWDKLFTLTTWIDAINQVYFCLSISQGGLYTLGRHNSFHYNHKSTCVFIAVLDGFTGILAGFAIFSVLGYMSDRTGIEVSDLAVGGPGLSFIVYPEALSLMPFPWVWCIFFFLMMIVIGFGSILSWMECVLDSSTELMKRWINTKRKELLYRLSVCMLFFVVGLFTLATRSGLYIEHLLDNYVTGYPVLICAALEAVGIGWIYGVSRIKEDLKLMSGKYVGIYWTACIAVITPILTIGGVILAVIANAEVTLNDYHYPHWAHVVGWTIVVIILSPLFIFFEISLSKYNFVRIWSPADSWLPAKQFPIDDGEVDLGKIANSSAKLLGTDDENTDEDSRPIRLSKKGNPENLVYIKEHEMTTNF